MSLGVINLNFTLRGAAKVQARLLDSAISYLGLPKVKLTTMLTKLAAKAAFKAAADPPPGAASFADRSFKYLAKL